MLGNRRLVAANSLPKYIAYSDTTGANYFPVNVPAVRYCTAVQPTGIIFTKPQNGQPASATLQIVDHTAAAVAFDALPPPTVNPPWGNTSTPFFDASGGIHAGNIFTDFWNWLVALFETIIADITDIIISIADEVMVAIRLIVNGVEQIFKAIVKVIDDIASAIGSFFLMLEKIIEDVIAALSVLFHFGEIMWTHRWLAGQVNSRIQDIQNAIAGQILPNVNQFFTNDSKAITNFFNSARAQIQGYGNQQLNNSPGSGQSVHTAFTVGSPGSTGSSHATQCAWSIQKMKSGLPSSSLPSTGASSRIAIRLDDDPLADFFTQFAQSLSSDPQLSAAFAQLKTDFADLFQAGSVTQFFSTLVITLLDMVETLLLAALDVAKGFVEGLLAVIDDAFSAVLGILNYQIEIPVLTWLYQTLFQEPLTLLNLATLVAAIPVTIVFRVVEGEYPSQANLPSAGAALTKLPQVVSQTVQMVLGCFSAVFQLIEGIANAVSDAGGDEAPPLVSYVSIGTGVLVSALSFPLITNSDASAADWVVFGIGLCSALSGLCGISYGGEDPPFATPVQSVLTCLLNTTSFGASIAAYVNDGKTDGITNASFAEEIIESVVGILNPIKLAGGEAAVLVAAGDCLGGIIELFMTIVIAIEGGAAEDKAISAMAVS